MTSPDELWKRRFLSYWRESASYWRYVLNNGVVMFSLFVVIGAAYYYGRILKELPEHFPYRIALALALLPVVAYGSVRTFLRRADLVFLLPLETTMGDYFRRCFLYAAVVQAAYVAAALTVAWPMYAHFAAPRGGAFLWALGFLWLLKAANTAGSWLETRFHHRRHRLAAALMRMGWTGAALYALWDGRLPLAALLAALGALSAAGVGRYTPKYRVHWQLLVEREAARQARLYSFFSWFQEVPERPVRPRRRTLLSKLAGRVNMAPANAYFYLYLLTFARSEIGGMTLRLAAAALALGFVLPSAPAQLVVYGLAVAAIGFQLSTLAQIHRYALWPELYPLPPASRTAALVRLALLCQIAAALALSVPLIVCHAPTLWYVPVLAVAASYALLRFVWPRKLARLFQAE